MSRQIFRKAKEITALALLLFSIQLISAQPRESLIKINVAPDHEDWVYKVGENVRFNVSVLKYGNPVSDIEIRYEIKPEKMEAVKSETITLKRSETMIKGGTMDQPGFLRCQVYATVDGVDYTGYATAAFAPGQIEPATTLPADFKAFWDKAVEENNKIPMDVQMTLLPERCTEKTDVYHVSLQNFTNGSRMYGILCKPKRAGKYPAVLNVPGAGIRPYYGDMELAEEGIITFQIGIHGIPVIMDSYIYDNLRYGALNNYWTMNLDDKDKYYYKRVYLGCVRAVDFISSLDAYDGTNLAVTGGSQGGALSIIAAGLDKRIKYLAALYPALSDMTGYREGRAGGWPHMFHPNDSSNYVDSKFETVKYYDVVNFARQLTQPGWYSWGFNDDVCPPTSMYASYNQITSPRELHIFQDTGHWTYPEQQEMRKKWLLEKLK